ncbi:MAG: class I SAM-dependent methyltransferase [Shimia sp.]
MSAERLEERLLRRIRAGGPMSVAEYMAEALLHPTLGYYTTRDPLGRDFTTAPEISQMFGELVGLALAQAWLDQGAPATVTLAELGPGRGTLMADAWRATAGVPGFHAAAWVLLIEASPVLRAEQTRRLPHARHADDLDGLPDAPLFLVANEFLDALPIRQFLRDGEGWRERLVGAADGALVWGLGDRSAQPALAHRLADTRDGDLIEHRPAAAPLAARIAGHLAAHGGAVLIVDYGGGASLGDTFQAVRGGAKVAPLDAPGTADLTAHVDFADLAAAAAPSADVHGPVPQGVWLERLGITARARALARGGDLDAVAAAHRRLTHPEAMGDLFKAMAIVPRGAPPPPGFAERP